MIDASRVTVRGAERVPAACSSQASFVLPGTRRSHPFRRHQPGFATRLEAWVGDPAFGVQIIERRERTVGAGRLHLARVRHAGAAGVRELVVAAWESSGGCVMTSVSSRELTSVERRLVSLPFAVGPVGATLALPVDARLRPPSAMLRIAEVGVCFVHPHTDVVMARVPRSRGAATAGGELFRVKAARRSLLLVTDTAVVDIEPERPDAVERARTLEIQWKRSA